MEDNRRTTHSVDDYYPNRPGRGTLTGKPLQPPDAEDTDANDARADRTDSLWFLCGCFR